MRVSAMDIHTYVKSKHKEHLRIKKFTLGHVVKTEGSNLIVAFGKGNSVNLTFKPELNKRGDQLFSLQLEDTKEAGSKGRMVAITKFEGHPITVKYQTHKHSFRRGKLTDKPSLVFKKRVKKTHTRTNDTAGGRKVE